MAIREQPKSSQLDFKTSNKSYKAFALTKENLVFLMEKMK